MQEQSDVELLRDYATNADEAAFREIVARYTDLVYSAALRQVSSAVVAREITQSVFTDLARKARSLATGRPGSSSLVGWLYRSTRFASLNHLVMTGVASREKGRLWNNSSPTPKPAPTGSASNPRSTKLWRI